MNLRIRPLDKRDAGRGIAAVNNQLMDYLELDKGDYLKIESDSNHTVAKVWPGYDDEDSGKKVIRIDGELRRQLGKSVDDSVSVEEVSVSEADEISVGIPDDLRISGDVKSYLSDKLEDMPVIEGQKLKLNLGLGLFGNEDKRVPVIIADTNPEDTVIVTEETKITEADIDVGQSNEEDDDFDSGVTYEDIGGLQDEIVKVREMVELPMNHPELFNQLGVDPPKGLLLHGPPGTGKTLLARAVANEVDAHFQTISGPEVMNQYYGKSEEKLREIFDEAEENSPAIIFFDEIDGIAPDRGGETNEFENRVVTQLLSLMDGLDNRGDVVVMAATNRADAIDDALRRGGRFDREIEIGVPDKEGRREVLDVHTRGMPLAGDVDLDEYAERTHGFVGADLATLSKEAAMNALRDFRGEIDLEEDTIDADVLNSIRIHENHFESSINDVEPSAMREFFVEVPDVTWGDVGGLAETKDKLQEMIQWPLDYDDLFENFNVDAAKGVLLHGPPGTGKTLLAKAVANESDSNFISVKGPELLSKAIGESEESVREVFDKARENSPSIIFFDELDAIAGERDGSSNDGGVTDRVVTQLLTELDGIEGLENVTVVATTNRPDMIDGALTRPGRLEQQIHVPVPDEDAREEIFKVHTSDKPVSDNVAIDELVAKTQGYVGADIEAVTREAAMIAIRDIVSTGQGDGDDAIGRPDGTLQMVHFEQALKQVNKSVTEQEREKYDEFADEDGNLNHDASGFESDPQRTAFH